MLLISLDGYEEEQQRREQYLFETVAKLGVFPEIDASRKIMVAPEPDRVIQKPKKKWYQSLWAVLVGIVLLVGFAWTCVQLYDRFFGY